MINWDNLAILLYGALGTAVLLLIQWLASLLLPRFPEEVQNRLRHIQHTTSSGEYEGDADIYSFDRALMEAELAQPGSTMRLYFSQPAALFARVIGSVLVSFTITGWVTGSFNIACASLLALGFGISLLLYPVMTWNSSRPRIEG